METLFENRTVRSNEMLDVLRKHSAVGRKTCLRLCVAAAVMFVAAVPVFLIEKKSGILFCAMGVFFW